MQRKDNIQLKESSNEMKCRKIPLEDLPDEMIINEVKRRKISLQHLEHLPDEFISANRPILEMDMFQPQLKKRKLALFEVKTETLPNEIWRKIFSYLEVHNLNRCACVSKQFHRFAYDKAVWQKLPINVSAKRVPIKFIQQIVERGTSYLNLDFTKIVGDQLALIKADQLHFAQPNCLKYLNLNSLRDQTEVRRNLLSSCTQLQKLGCDFDKSEVDVVSQCIRFNSKTLKCLKIFVNLDKLDEMSVFKLATAINKCQQLEELSLEDGEPSTYNLPPQNLKKLHLWHDGKFKVEDIKVLVDTCSKLEDMFLEMFDCCEDFLKSNKKLEDSTCCHFAEIISTIAESSLSETLVNLGYQYGGKIDDYEQFDTKCLEFGKKMKRLEKIYLPDFHWTSGKEGKNILRKTLPHLTIVENRYFGRKNFSGDSGLWEISCNRLSLFRNLNV